jgi:hypothetical protein
MLAERPSFFNREGFGKGAWWGNPKKSRTLSRRRNSLCRCRRVEKSQDRVCYAPSDFRCGVNLISRQIE